MTRVRIRQIFFSIVVAYFLVIGFFYFLLGEQLRYKNASNIVLMPRVETASEEIINGNTISQDFYNDVDRLQAMSLVFTKFYKTGSGTVDIVLSDGNRILYSTKVNIPDIPEQQPLIVTPSRPIEARGKVLTLSISSNATKGNGVAIMLNRSDATKNNIVTDGYTKYKAILCFSTSGVDTIEFYNYYWYIMSLVGILLALALYLSYRQFINGRSNYIISALFNIYQYKFLISQLVSRDFKSKYKRSVLGVFWSFLNPLLTMTVQFLVFSTFFKADTQNYPVYLLSGVICFNFFKETTDMCLSSITGNANLINKVYIPKYIFPMSKTISCSINLGMSLIPLFIVSLLMGVNFTRAVFLIFFFLLCLILFTLGVGMLLATMMVFFRDIQFLWGVIAQIWMYATPIFYPSEIIPEKYRFIVRFNPLYHFIGNIRKCLIDGISPEPISYIYCLIFAIGMFILGSYVFKKTQDQFTLHL